MLAGQGERQIHAATMRMLATKGVGFNKPEAVELARKRGLKVDGMTVFFQEDQLMGLLATAPARFKMSGPDPGKAVLVGGPATLHIPGGGSQFLLQEDGVLRDAVLDDHTRLTKLFHPAPEIPIMAGMVVQPNDVDSRDAVPQVLFRYLRQSDKPLLTMAGDERTTRMALHMTAIAHGGESELVKGAKIMVVANPLSPLRMDANATGFLMAFAAKNQPVCVAPCAMAGTTAPMTLAGAFAQTNAETLAGLALCQMVNPGAPVVYGFLTTVSDLRTGAIATGAPEQAISAYWGGRLARMYNLPSRLGGGGLTDADITGVQSGYESMMNLLCASQAGSSISFQAAGVLGAFNAMSLSKAVADLEVIRMVQRIEADIVISEETLAEDVIAKVAPEGQYLTQAHTLRHCRSEVFQPRVSHRGPMARDEQYQLERSRIAKEIARRESAYVAPDIPPSVERDLRAYLASEGVTPKEG